MLARTRESLGTDLLEVGRVAAQDTPIPASVPLEDRMLPQVETIMQTALKMV